MRMSRGRFFIECFYQASQIGAVSILEMLATLFPPDKSMTFSGECEIVLSRTAKVQI